MPVYQLPEEPWFPPVSHAEEDGMLAVGGDLSVERLLQAYWHGIFPWYSEESPILWWSPDPRMVLFPDELRIQKSMRPILRQKRFDIRVDTAFAEVIRRCRTVPREGQDGTWLTDEMQAAYTQLHELGLAHSVEAWREGRLVGGLYGVSLGRVFYGESMFSLEPNASKAAFIHLVQGLKRQGFQLLDCQIYTGHLERLGAREIPREAFQAALKEALVYPTLQGKWTHEPHFQPGVEI